MKSSLSLFLSLAYFCFFLTHAQAQLLHDEKLVFTHDDTLRGELNENRNWWDVLHYQIEITPDFETKTVVGKTTIKAKLVIPFLASEDERWMQIDLQPPLIIDSVLCHGQKLFFKKDGLKDWLVLCKKNGLNIAKADALKANKDNQIQVEIYYHGTPKEAIKAPWDGGWIWKKDALGRPWMSVACQGLGASVWFPCKDHQSDEPNNGASLSVTVADSLVVVANGRLSSVKHSGNDKHKKATYTWQVINPINNYNITPYIGKYVHFGENYMGEKGNLTCDYWVLDYNVSKAKLQFKQVPKMLEAFEYWFGPYPFYEDGYKLVEAPHLGMEHQSAVAYGNGFKNGYLGRDLSATGQGLKWDFILVHESGHEWFGNNITSKDIADMWIHEGFTCYSETLFTQYWFGKKNANKYITGLRKNIINDIPIVAPYGVNKDGSGDMYYKAANMLHTIRQIINNDTLFRKILRGLNKVFYHQTITSNQIFEYINQQARIDFSKIFYQYLYTTKVPTLQWKYTVNQLSLHWINTTTDFAMPVVFYDQKGVRKQINVYANKWVSTNSSFPLFEPNLYVGYEKMPQ